ncbi:MAG TPA: hypothetical protein VKE51_30565 [Vicinamibacterales bacterium]|nr:hypothetical protein [Vicinamibacterales bacterium]
MRHLAHAWHEVDPSDPVREAAVRFVRVHPLRGADALQLAAAFVAAERRPSSLEVITLDDRLTVAANEAFDTPVPTATRNNSPTVSAADGRGNQTSDLYQVDLAGVSKTLTYDANGNFTSDGTRAFEWDAVRIPASQPDKITCAFNDSQHRAISLWNSRVQMPCWSRCWFLARISVGRYGRPTVRVKGRTHPNRFFIRQRP